MFNDFDEQPKNKAVRRKHSFQGTVSKKEIIQETIERAIVLQKEMYRKEIIRTLTNNNLHVSNETINILVDTTFIEYEKRFTPQFLCEDNLHIIIESLLEVIAKHMKDNEKALFKNFGEFYAITRPNMKGHNPYTKESMTVLAKQVPKFSAGKGLRAYINDEPDAKNSYFKRTLSSDKAFSIINLKRHLMFTDENMKQRQANELNNNSSEVNNDNN